MLVYTDIINHFLNLEVIKKLPTILEAAIAKQELTTFVAAVESAKLVDTLKEDGPFTVFAPNNAAFDKYPEIKKLIKESNSESEIELKEMLQRHVVTGDALKKTNIGPGTIEKTTVGGKKIKITKTNENVEIESTEGKKAAVTEADIVASNAVIHIVNDVI